jgi:hypothetical protein
MSPKAGRRCYNEERLHAVLGYPPPAEYYARDLAARQAERRAKLERAAQHRRAVNSGRRAARPSPEMV